LVDQEPVLRTNNKRAYGFFASVESTTTQIVFHLAAPQIIAASRIVRMSQAAVEISGRKTEWM
jgi:hypothetical protein